MILSQVVHLASQDLSVAGLKAGLQGERSGLFLEQIRIIKEMRQYDRQANRRSDQLVRPRFCVWENVPGALSSNEGKDFQRILTEFIKVSQPNAPDVPMPDRGGWTKSGFLYDEMGRWSIAWRIHDAQFWGVPQRRKRIALVADFNGLSAGRIMFDPQYRRETKSGKSNGAKSDIGKECGQQIQSFCESMSWNSEQGEKEREETSGDIGKCAEETNRSINNVHVFDASRRHNYEPFGDICETVQASYGTGGGNIPIVIEGNGSRPSHKGDGFTESETMYTLNSTEKHAVVYGITSYNSNSFKSSNPNSAIFKTDIAKTLDLNCGNPSCQQGGIVVVDSHCKKEPITIEMTSTKNTIGQNGIMPTLTARMGTGGNQVNAVLTEKNNYQETVGALCACDYKGISNTYVEQAKVILQKVPANAVLMDSYQHYGYKENETTGTLTADQNMHVRGDTPLVIDEVDVARRLTPLECERLQNFPNGWTDIGEWEDDDGKLHKCSDTPRYKALGNAIALPFWEWLARQISAQYETPCTMGGLFSGIGGFELAFARCGIKPQFTCEIEQFPRAVLRKHFGDNKTGQEGDYYKYL